MKENNRKILDDYYDFFMSSPSLKYFEILGGVLKNRGTSAKYNEYAKLLKELHYSAFTGAKTYVVSKDDELFVGTMDEVCEEFGVTEGFIRKVFHELKLWEYEIKERTFEDYLEYLKEKENESK